VVGESRLLNRVKIRSRTNSTWELEGNILWQTEHDFAFETGFYVQDSKGNDVIKYETLELSFDKWTVIYRF
jgi:hypothetical protein